MHMKKIFFYWLILLSFLLSFNKLDAQTSKLIGAFAASSGIAVDSKGNAFVTGKNGKIIKVTPAGKAELFAGGGRNGQDGQGKEADFSRLKAAV